MELESRIRGQLSGTVSIVFADLVQNVLGRV
jgi:hypothetical protein